METSEVALIISAVAASIASVVYSMKHIKKSSCCGAFCEQVIVEEESGKLKEIKNSVIIEDEDTKRGRNTTEI